jgi:hypothetical protein
MLTETAKMDCPRKLFSYACYRRGFLFARNAGTWLEVG